MAQSAQESSLDKLLKSRYPLTYYLSRQQQFTQLHSTIPSVAVSTSSAVSAPVATRERKIPPQQPPPVCFNVPDTLDFDTTEYEQNIEMDEDTGLNEEDSRKFDETLLFKDINNRMNDRNGDILNERNSSAIQLEFSPYEHNSPLQKAIQNGLNIINK